MSESLNEGSGAVLKVHSKWTRSGPQALSDRTAGRGAGRFMPYGMAEGVGFEPTDRVNGRRFSRPQLSYY